MARREPIAVELIPRKRGGRLRAAVVALEGSRGRDVRLAISAAGPFDPSPLVVAVDGGIAGCRAAGRRPDLFVGDLDSARRPPKGVPATIYPVAKDFSDFSGALDEVRRRGVDVAVVAGLLGGRLDHEWANLLEVGSAAPRFAALLAPSSRGLVVVTSRGLSTTAARGRLVSVFALGGVARVTLRGTRWELARRRLTPGSLGLSNVAAGAMSVVVHEGVAAVVFPSLRR